SRYEIASPPAMRPNTSADIFTERLRMRFLSCAHSCSDASPAVRRFHTLNEGMLIEHNVSPEIAVSWGAHKRRPSILPAVGPTPHGRLRAPRLLSLHSWGDAPNRRAPSNASLEMQD